MPIDIVLLNLHGAMIADGYDDCEGDILGRVRQIVGTMAVVGAELDLHANLTAMREHASCLVAHKEYPHTDISLRAAELFDICLAARQGRVKPTMAALDCRVLGQWRTTASPIREFVARISEIEKREGVLSISFIHASHGGTSPMSEPKFSR